MISILLTAIISLGVGVVIGYLIASLRNKDAGARIATLLQQNDFLAQQAQAEEQRWQDRQKQLEERFRNQYWQCHRPHQH